MWKINNKSIEAGFIAHTAGYPLSRNNFGGGFIYLGADNTLSLGLIVGLSYKNPYLNPYEEFQTFKTHPFIADLLKDGQRIGYGARVLEEGGFYSLPEKPGVPGLLVVGSAAGYLDFSKIKGVHNALRSGKVAAESAFAALLDEKPETVVEIHDKNIKNSTVYKELYEVRGYPGTFLKHTYLGYAFSLISSFKPGKALMNCLSFKKTKPCCDNTKCATEVKKIDYPPHDNTYSFDIDKSLALSGVHHEYDQPCHLKVKGDPKEYAETARKIYDKPEERFCPGKVFEFSGNELKMNAQNCLHCKTCTIKSYKERIEWTCPEGNGGPN